MSAQPEKRPRHYAYELVDAWVSGRPVEPIVARIPANFRQLAGTHARLFCMNIKHHARHTEDVAVLGVQMTEWVAKYRLRSTV